MTKRVTIADIAKKAGLSSTTVSFVLNGRQQGISPETEKRVIEIALELGYDRINRIRLEGWTRVAFLTQNIEFFNSHTSFFAGVYHHLHRKAVEKKLELFLLELNLNGGANSVYCQIREMRANGIDIFLTQSRAIVDHLLEQNQKIILVQGGAREDCISIYCDDYAAGQVAANHALEMGHTQAGTIFPGPGPGSPRYQGFVETFTSKGGTCPEQFHWEIPGTHDEMIPQIAKLSREAGSLPSLFYCFADNVLFPVIRGFAENNLGVPDDISLIGADNLYWGKYAHPPFTTVDLCEDLFADKLIEAIGHAGQNPTPYQLAVPVRLIRRGTVRKIK